MEKWIELIKDNGPLLINWLLSLGLCATGGVGADKLAMNKKRRVISNLLRPIMIIGTPGQDMKDQERLLKEVGLFVLSDLAEGAKAPDSLHPKHRLLILGYSGTSEFQKAFE